MIISLSNCDGPCDGVVRPPLLKVAAMGRGNGRNANDICQSGCGSRPRHRYFAVFASAVDLSALILIPDERGRSIDKAVASGSCIILSGDSTHIGMPRAARSWSPHSWSALPMTAMPMTAMEGRRRDRVRELSPILLLDVTRFGASVFTPGSDNQVAAMMVVRTGRTNISVLALWAGFSGLAGALFSHYTTACYSLAPIGVEPDTIAAVMIGGTLLSGSESFPLDTSIDVLTQGLIQIHITFDCMLFNGPTKIVVGLLLFAFILLPRILVCLSARRAAGARGNM